MNALPLRIPSQADLRQVLAALPTRHGVDAAFVVQGIGSLSVAQIRFAGAPDFTELHGDRFSREHDPATGFKELFVAGADAA
jgi:predicted DNA-binding protein with PD1-like motif